MEQEKYNTKDALGNEIIIGNKYGYSQSKNGFVNISVGVAKHFTRKGLLTLEVSERRRSLYEGEPELQTDPHGSSSCKPAMLFPVQ